MRILVTSIIDVTRSAPNRLHHFIKHLAAHHRITVVCIRDWWKADQVNVSEQYQDFKDVIDEIDVRFITGKKINPIWQEVFSPFFLDIPKAGFDIIFNYNTLVSGFYIARKLKLPVVYDLADDLPGMIAGSPQIPSPLRLLAQRVGKYTLGQSLAGADRITGISGNLLDEFESCRHKFNLISNGVDTSLFRKMDSDKKQVLGLGNHFILGYVGVLREWVDFEPVFQVLADSNNIRLLVVGEEGRLKENKELMRKYRVEDKVVFTGTVPYAKVPKYIAAMDACLIPLKRNSVTEQAVPLKLFEYMACEKPVIATPLAGVKKVASNRILYAGNASELDRIVGDLAGNDGWRQNLGFEGRKYVDSTFSWSASCAGLEAILSEVSHR